MSRIQAITDPLGREYHPADMIMATRRVTTPFLAALPKNLNRFNAHIQARVKRKDGEDAILDPCSFDWDRMAITIVIPLDKNEGLYRIEDLEPNFFEALEAAFLNLIHNCSP